MAEAATVSVEAGPGKGLVVTISGRRWPAWPGAHGGTLIDFRLYGRGECGAEALGYYPDKLREAKVPEGLVEAAADSVPPGFVLLGDLRPVEEV
jgi:hypothetical protein